MKKLILLFSLMYLGTLVAFTQSLVLMNSNGVVNNGDTITYYSTDANATFVCHVMVKNTSSSDIAVRAKKVELDTVPGSENYFCWTQCYMPSIYIGDTLIIKAGATNKNSFSGDYDAMGNAGKTRIRYVFYDDANPSDSVSFVVEYYAGSGVGYQIDKRISAEAKVYPNPARNGFTLSYSLSQNSDNAVFELRNILGSKIRSIKLSGVSGQKRIDVSDLQNGVYFYTVRIDGNAVVSRKLIIRK